MFNLLTLVAAAGALCWRAAGNIITPSSYIILFNRKKNRLC